ncbi:hypothetical protein WG899_18725 [Paucibacter sp. AS339]|uniref:hypothetical protein n=1 Tax=Paucibacter hankyongi TaxID=3133434 RepID=UPI0030A7E0AF
MFSRELTELKQRQLALKLRNIELRAELRSELGALARPAGWMGLAGGAAGLVLLLAGLRRPGRLSKMLGWTQLVLRLIRLFSKP